MHRVERLASLPAIDNVQVVEAAISHGEGMLRLAKGPDSGSVTALDWAHDVEGWEAHVLQGATQKSGSAPEEILQLLKLSGFTAFREVPRSGLRRFAPPGEITNVLAGRDVRS